MFTRESKQRKKCNPKSENMNRKEKKQATITEKTDLLTLLQIVSEAAHGSGSVEKVLENAGSAVVALAKELECTENQALLFSVSFNLSFESSTITISELARFLKCPPIQMARHTADLNELARVKLLKKDKGERFRYSSRNELPRYYVPANHLESISSGLNFDRTGPEYHSLEEMLAMAGSQMDNSIEQKLGSEENASEIKAILTCNLKLKFSKVLLNMKLMDESILITVLLAVNLVNGREQLCLDNILTWLFPEAVKQIYLKRSFKQGEHELIKKGVVCFEPSAFKSELIIKLSEKFTNRLFAGEKELFETGNSGQNVQLILHEIIHEKQMFYTEEEARNLSFLEESLMPGNFKKLENKLKEKGLSQGVNILFYGPPGTGKTETVYQLARKTGRDIRKIDVSETKSMWFGESEKIIKKKFDQYRALVKTCKIAPILFFNEADGIFGKRKDTTTSSTGQTENAIQNIILQEMETLSGIMIATTNMAGNLDKAFDRRFLYKILFEKPDIHARCMIWETRLPLLSMDFIRHLAENFNLTGGQIDNIVRKHTMHQVIKDKEPELTDIVKWCREESMIDEYAKIGFRI
jgi:hypothetical protein